MSKKKKVDYGQFTSVKGLSEVTRFPWMGKIRLGLDKDETDTGAPREVDYFRPPVGQYHDLFVEHYGSQPKALPVIFPVNDRGVVFKQAFKWYGTNQLKCIGNGTNAVRRTIVDDQLIEQPQECLAEECPDYSNRKCGLKATLLVVLPKINVLGVWAITTSSVNSVMNINTALADIASEERFGSFANLMNGETLTPLLELQRVAQTTFGGGKKNKPHYPLQLVLNLGSDDFLEARAKIRVSLIGGHVQVDDQEFDAYDATVDGDHVDVADPLFKEASPDSPDAGATAGTDIPPPKPKPEKQAAASTKDSQAPEKSAGRRAMEKRLLKLVTKIYGAVDGPAAIEWLRMYGADTVEDIVDDATLELAMNAAAVNKKVKDNPEDVWEN